MRNARGLVVALAFVTLTGCDQDVVGPQVKGIGETKAHFSPGTGAHFQNLDVDFDGQGNITVSFKESGLGNSPEGGTVHIELTANASATYACINGGGNHPKAQNKEQVAGPVTASGDFPVGKNGSVTGSLTISPPPSALFCPNGQTHVLADVEFTNVTLSDVTNAISQLFDGPFLLILIILT